MNTHEAETSYDRIPYDSHPYDRTHPDHLATMGRVFGMQPPDPDHCRVLELGCAAGGNLIPLAVSMPDATFHGVDLSRMQVQQGHELIDQLQLKNIQLQPRSILDIGPDDGLYDYIVCHGVYSWVPREVQEHILRVCKQNLSPQGIAYVSYNTYPGWFMRGMVRDMMCFHARQFDDPQTQVEQARALLDFLIDAGPGGDELYHHLLKRELQIVRNRADSYLYHEHLEEVNEPLFFYQFMQRCDDHGLRYLSEAQLSEMLPNSMSPKVEEALRTLGTSIIHAEQYLDFLRNRTFRRTLLCHQSVELKRELNADQLGGLHVASPLQPEQLPVDLNSHAEQSFRVHGSGPSVGVTRPLLKASLACLAKAWPASIPFDKLPARAYAAQGEVLVREAEGHSQDLRELAGLIWQLLARDLVEVRLSPVRYPQQATERPLASPLAKLMAERGKSVTNLRHETVQISDLHRHLLRELDGQCDRGMLCDRLHDRLDAGEIVIQREAGPLGRDEESRQFLEELISRQLDSLAMQGLLLA